jgi:hypothetical protein
MKRVALVVAFMGLITGGLLTNPVAAYRAPRDQKEWPARKVCITYLTSIIDPQGREAFTTIRWHYTDSADSTQFKIAHRSIGKARRVEFAYETDGLVVETDSKEKIRLGDCASAFQLESPADVTQTDISRRSHTAEYFLKSPSFTSTDVVAGFPVFVWRRYADDDGGWMELSFSPQVGSIPLSTTFHAPDGSQRRSVAIKVELL